MKKQRLVLDADIDIERPELGVTVTLIRTAILAMARKAHDNRGRKSRGGPAIVAVTGKRPEAFQDRYWIYYETSRENGHGSGSRPRLTRAQAETVFKTSTESGDYSYVALRGPRLPQDRSWVTLAENGTPRASK